MSGREDPKCSRATNRVKQSHKSKELLSRSDSRVSYGVSLSASLVADCYLGMCSDEDGAREGWGTGGQGRGRERDRERVRH